MITIESTPTDARGILSFSFNYESCVNHIRYTVVDIALISTCIGTPMMC